MLMEATMLIAIAALNLDEEGRFLVSPSIEFATGRPTREEAEGHSYPFTAKEIRVLGQVVNVINAAPISHPIRITGHTDNVECTPYAAPSSATLDPRGLCVGLAHYRVMVVVWKLIDLGVDNSKIVESSPGDLFPIAANDTEEGRARNRVVQFVDAFAKEPGVTNESAPKKR